MKLSEENLEFEISIAPLAIPISAELLKEQGIELSSLTEAKVPSEVESFHVCDESNQPKKAESIITYRTDSSIHQSKDAGTFEIDRSPPIALREGNSKVSKEIVSEDGIIDPKSFHTFLAAFCSLLFFFSTLFGVAGLILLIIDQEQKLFLIGPGLTLVSAIFYVLFAYRKRCCVCHQSQFTKAQNRKKGRSHYIPLLGYIIPTSFQIILHRKFYCMICNSKIRIFK